MMNARLFNSVGAKIAVIKIRPYALMNAKNFVMTKANLIAYAVLLGGSTFLVSAPAHAANTCSFDNTSITTPVLPLPSCVNGFTFDPVLGATVKITKTPTVGRGTVQFFDQAGIWVVDLDFIPDLEAISGEGKFSYDMTIATAGTAFDEVGLAIIGPPIGSPSFVAIKDAANSGSSVINLSVDQDKLKDFDAFGPDLTTINVTDTYSVSFRSINNLQNSFSRREFAPPESEVPGPLPLLGAGATFGFSRRLRSRLLAARRA